MVHSRDLMESMIDTRSIRSWGTKCKIRATRAARTIRRRRSKRKFDAFELRSSNADATASLSCNATTEKSNTFHCHPSPKKKLQRWAAIRHKSSNTKAPQNTTSM
mmetsp:Transcript_19659/g.41852  ORF Transcript_19659/g.41852 Transcript_19659/m.41852 type:complete len:105 (-) Transcript_19659:334-648(-)